MDTVTGITVRPAIADDLHEIAACIEEFVAEGKVLPRTIKELDELLPFYMVAESNGELIGCAVLEVYSRKLAEIRSLAVKRSFQGKGIGKRLVEACLNRAKEQNILEVMAITSNEDFFLKCGFDFTLPGEKKALFFLSGTVS